MKKIHITAQDCFNNPLPLFLRLRRAFGERVVLLKSISGQTRLSVVIESDWHSYIAARWDGSTVDLHDDGTAEHESTGARLAWTPCP